MKLYCQKRHTKSVLQLVAFEVLTAVDINVAVFYDIALCSPYVNDVSEERIASVFRAENQASKLSGG
jgi:hypothetical protein